MDGPMDRAKIEELVADIWKEVSNGREGYISSDLKEAALEGIRAGLKHGYLAGWVEGVKQHKNDGGMG